MLPRDINSTTAEVVAQLVGTPEGPTIEFKETLPLSTRDDKKEFAADVAAFGNASGGDILIGVSERNESGDRFGVATAVAGVACKPDAAILAIESIIRDGIAPRLTGVRTVAVQMSAGMYVLIVRIPQSWNGPHMVTYGVSRFFVRGSRGKHPLDVTQIRAAFAASETQVEHLRAFRDDRVGRVISMSTPVPLRQTATFLTHIVPSEALAPHHSMNPRAFEPFQARLAEPQKMSSPKWRYNLDGFCVSQGSETEARGYVQCFRSGIIEYADAYYLPMDRKGYETSVYTHRFEGAVIAQVAAALNVMHALQLSAPVYIFVTVIGVKGWLLYEWDKMRGTHFRFDRDVVALPDIGIDNLDEAFVPKLKTVFDAFWQAAGASHSPNFKGDVWIGLRE